MERLRSAPRPFLVLLSLAAVVAALLLSVRAGSSALWKGEAPISDGIHVETGTLTVQVSDSPDGGFSDALALTDLASDNLGPGETVPATFWIKNTGTVSIDVTATVEAGDTGQLSPLGSLFWGTVTFADGAPTTQPRNLQPGETTEVRFRVGLDYDAVGNDYQGAATGAAPFGVRIDAVQES